MFLQLIDTKQKLDTIQRYIKLIYKDTNAIRINENKLNITFKDKKEYKLIDYIFKTIYNAK